MALFHQGFKASHLIPAMLLGKIDCLIGALKG